MNLSFLLMDLIVDFAVREEAEVIVLDLPFERPMAEDLWKLWIMLVLRFY